MAKTGTSSMRRGKPNYTYSIVGVAIVLFILGFMTWVFILVIKQGSDALKENIQISAYLKTTNKDSINAVKTYITSQPWAKNVVYTDKEKARENWLKDGNEDWQKILPNDNPLPESIDFNTQARYVNNDSLAKISSQITALFPLAVGDVQYRKSAVASINQHAEQFGLICLVIAVVLCIVVIVSIDNTIRLAMFSNRFLIKTMQMVGATRGFIARPMGLRALLNGFISSLIAIALLFAFIQFAENIVPDLKQIHNNGLLGLLFAGIAVVGITISFFSTHRSVMKYLRMKLDDLY